MFTGNAEEQTVTFPNGDGNPVKRYNYEIFIRKLRSDKSASNWACQGVKLKWRL